VIPDVVTMTNEKSNTELMDKTPVNLGEKTLEKSSLDFIKLASTGTMTLRNNDYKAILSKSIQKTPKAKNKYLSCTVIELLPELEKDQVDLSSQIQIVTDQKLPKLPKDLKQKQMLKRMNNVNI
jgi:hypothetical protein